MPNKKELSQYESPTHTFFVLLISPLPLRIPALKNSPVLTLLNITPPPTQYAILVLLDDLY
ncbi:hypothetical protein D3C75_1033130 [compost metagenome]